MVNLVVVRHGQSVWNEENRLTGLVDVGLSKQGIAESQQVAERLKDIHFDVAFTSKLHRAIDTLNIILQHKNLTHIPVFADAALNQNNKGTLQGLTQAELTEKYGADRMEQWQQHFDAPPPDGESLENLYTKIAPFYENSMLPNLVAGKNTLVVAHGNSIRALMMHLESLDKKTVEALNVPTGQPVLYRMIPITVPEPSSETIGTYLRNTHSVEQVRKYMAISEKITILASDN